MSDPVMITIERTQLIEAMALAMAAAEYEMTEDFRDLYDDKHLHWAQFREERQKQIVKRFTDQCVRLMKEALEQVEDLEEKLNGPSKDEEE